MIVYSLTLILKLPSTVHGLVYISQVLIECALDCWTSQVKNMYFIGQQSYFLSNLAFPSVKCKSKSQ